MAGIKKKESGGFKDKFSTKTKYKETSYYFCGDAFAFVAHDYLNFIYVYRPL